MDVLWWGLSMLSMLFGVMMFLGPQVVSRWNSVLNRNLFVVDTQLLRFRYVVGLLLMVSSYLFFVMKLNAS